MFTKFLSIAVMSGVLASGGWFLSGAESSTQPCNCCVLCVCDSCQCDEGACECGSGGACGCSAECCATCCNESSERPTEALADSNCCAFDHCAVSQD